MFVIQRRLMSTGQPPLLGGKILEFLQPKDGGTYIDLRFGEGHYTKLLLETHKAIRVIAIDQDIEAIEKARELSSQIAKNSYLSNIKQSVIPIHGKYSKIMEGIRLSGVPHRSVQGALLVREQPKQFFIKEGPLDFRIDKSVDSDITAEDVVNNLDQKSLAQVIKVLGEERRYLKIANTIIDARVLLGRIRTVQELYRALSSIHLQPTSVVKALRRFVNNDLNELNYGLDKIREFLTPGEGIMAVLTFNKTEDLIVKQKFSGIDPKQPLMKWLSQHDRIRCNVEPKEELKPDWILKTKRVCKASSHELAQNPDFLTAKLRAAVRNI